MESLENARPLRFNAWDGDAVPKTRPVADWPALLRRLARAEDWAKTSTNAELSERLRAFARHCLRFARPDGSLIFGDDAQAILEPLIAWAKVADDDGIQTVLDRRSPPKRRKPTIAPPPLPAFAAEKRPLAILRPDWSDRGDWIAIDQRNADAACLVELCGGGKRWVGSNWGDPSNAPAKVVHWSTDSRADLFEWSFPGEHGKVVRTALLARGRGWGILGEEVPLSRASGLAKLRLDLPTGVSSNRSAEAAALTLSSGRRRALVAPIGLESKDFRVENHRLALDQTASGRRAWLPLLFVWDSELLKKKLVWKPLTVAEKSRVCPSDVAFAARASWGTSESIVVYRSLGRPAPRSFLGHQTAARFLVGRFHHDGRVEPIVLVE